MLFITQKKDLSIFIKIISYGAYFVSLLILTIVGFGIYSFTNTDFEFGNQVLPDYKTEIRPIALASAGFPSLAGVLCVGFFLHPASVPILKKNANQEKTNRDLFLAYLVVFVFFALVGVFGYFGFKGVYFDHYYKKEGEYVINQNCLNMFSATDPIGFLLRALFFLMLCCTFPLVNHILKTMVITLIWGSKEVSKATFTAVSTIQLIFPLLFAIFYPNVGSILSWSGSIAGLFIIYILPVVIHLKMVKTRY